MKDYGKQITEYLDNASIKMTDHEDGRIQSLHSEANVYNLIKDGLDEIPFVDKTGNRDFGDFAINVDGKDIPVNIKIVDPNKSGTFNAGGVSLFSYMFFGKNINSFERLATALKSHYDESKPKVLAEEYYYLFVFKDGSPSIFTALTDLASETLIANPSNPLQVKTNSIRHVERSEENKWNLIYNLFRDVCEKRAKAFFNLPC